MNSACMPNITLLTSISIAPAILDPGENTTSEMDDDEFRYFQIECAAFSVTVLIEQTDHEGSCSLYASTVVQHPGPLDPPDVVVKNEDHRVQTRFLHLNTSRVNDSSRTVSQYRRPGRDCKNLILANGKCVSSTQH